MNKDDQRDTTNKNKENNHNMNSPASEDEEDEQEETISPLPLTSRPRRMPNINNSNTATKTASQRRLHQSMPPMRLSSEDGSKTAQDRWRMLRTVRRVQSVLVHSLQAEERELLQHISSSSTTAKPTTTIPPHTTNKNVDSNRDVHRQELHKVLQEHKESLPAAETEYLHQLIASPHVSSEWVGKARQSVVWSLSRSAALHESLRTAADETPSTKTMIRSTPLQGSIPEGGGGEVGRPSLKQVPTDASFRKELWNFSESSLSLASAEQSPKTEQQQQQSQPPAPDNNNNNADTNAANPWTSWFPFWTGPTSRPSTDDQSKATAVTQEDDDDEDELWDYRILGTLGGTDPDCAPHVLTPPMMRALRPHLPTSIQCDNFWLKYSLLRDGASLETMVHQLRNSTRTVLAVETTDGHVLGAVCSSPWTPHGHKFFGSGESFVWQLRRSRYTPCATVQDQVALEQEVDLYKWSGHNRNVQRLVHVHEPLMLGGGGPDEVDATGTVHGSDDAFGSALILSPDLEFGHSHACLTFNSPPLLQQNNDNTTKKERLQFAIRNVEVWTLTPVDTLDQAEKVELGRRFIFEQGAFVQD